MVGVEGIDDTDASVIDGLIIFGHDGSNLFSVGLIVPT